MDSNYKVCRNGTGRLFAIDNNGFKSEVNPADFSSWLSASSLKPGEYMDVKTNNYSTIKNGIFSSVDSCRCSYNFSLKK